MAAVVVLSSARPADVLKNERHSAAARSCRAQTVVVGADGDKKKQK